MVYFTANFSQLVKLQETAVVSRTKEYFQFKQQQIMTLQLMLVDSNFEWVVNLELSLDFNQATEM